MNILFVHQNFPGQFPDLAPALVERGHSVVALTLRNLGGAQWRGIRIVNYRLARGNGQGIHPWLLDFESKVIRGEACMKAALALRAEGFVPDVIVAHPGWGESLFLNEVWPKAKLGLYCMFFYHAQGADVGFDPEFPSDIVQDRCRIQLKNLTQSLHFKSMVAGLSPTRWQATTFPASVRKRISVIHDGIDTGSIVPNEQAKLRLGNGLELTRADELVTFVSRSLEPCRGFHILMRALPALLLKNPRLRVVIVGGSENGYGPAPGDGQTWREKLSQEIRPVLSEAQWDRVHFLGKIPHNQFVTLLQISTVHVYLTYPFVLSRSLLEAMSAGCAIVASATRPVKEVIVHDKTGRLVDFFDVEQLEKEISALLAEANARSRLGRNARTLVKAKFDLKLHCLPAQIRWVEGLGA